MDNERVREERNRKRTACCNRAISSHIQGFGLKWFDCCLCYLLITYLGKEGREIEFCSVGIWTQAKVPTTSGLINCMAKKKGHLSPTNNRDQHCQSGDIHTCANAHTHAHTHPVHRAHVTQRNTGLIGGTRHLELSILSSRTCTELSESVNEVCVLSSTVCVLLVCTGVPQCMVMCVRLWAFVCGSHSSLSSSQKLWQAGKGKCRNSAVFGGGPLITRWFSLSHTHTQTARAHTCNTFCYINSFCTIIAAQW